MVRPISVTMPNNEFLEITISNLSAKLSSKKGSPFLAFEGYTLLETVKTSQQKNVKKKFLFFKIFQMFFLEFRLFYLGQGYSVEVICF